MNNEIILNKLIDKMTMKSNTTIPNEPSSFSFETLSTTPQNTLFIYFVIVILIFFGIGKYDITLNVIVSILVSYGIIYYMILRRRVCR